MNSYHWTKDKQLRLTGCCEAFAELASVESPRNVIGKKSDELIWQERAKHYFAEDKYAMKKGYYQGLQIAQTTRGEARFLVTKIALYDRHGRLSGTTGSMSNFQLLNTEDNTPPELSCKESLILQYVALGYTAKQISEKLCRSRRTIESHIIQIKLKLNCKDRAALIETAVSLGLIHIAFAN